MAKDMPQFLHDTLIEGVEEVKSALTEKRSLIFHDAPGAELLPIKVSTETDETSDEARLKLETIVGRGLWLFNMRHLLTSTLNALLLHRWTIFRSPPGEAWFTSDDPVVPLKFYGPERYDFLGGWAREGTEIFLPLSPKHLLYTKVGAKPPKRGTVANRAQFEWIQRFTAEHAHRYIIARQADPLVLRMHPRSVDQTAFRAEADQWERWHAEQTEAELRLQGNIQTNPHT